MKQRSELSRIDQLIGHCSDTYPTALTQLVGIGLGTLTEAERLGLITFKLEHNSRRRQSDYYVRLTEAGQARRLALVEEAEKREAAEQCKQLAELGTCPLCGGAPFDNSMGGIVCGEPACVLHYNVLSAEAWKKLHALAQKIQDVQEAVQYQQFLAEHLVPEGDVSGCLLEALRHIQEKL